MGTRIKVALGVVAVGLVLGAVVPSLAGPGGSKGEESQDDAPAGTSSGSGSSDPGAPVSVDPAPPPDSVGGGAPGSPVITRVAPDTSGAVGPAGPANTVTVTGSAIVTSRPDEAVVGLGVRTEASDADDALQQNAERMEAALGALADAGIAEDDISTTYVSLYPNYTGDGTTASTFVAENQISVTVRDVDRVGQVIDAAVGAGANLTSGITFQLSERNQGVTQALREAVDNARSKAATLAEAAGASLGNIVSIQETSGGPSPVFTDRGIAEDTAGTPINPPDVQTQVSVVAVWELQIE